MYAIRSYYGCLRMSIVNNPLARINTGDNTPAVVNIDITPGDRLKISLLIKGAGCDNVSALRMFTPAQGLAEAKDFIVEVADNAGPNASPPFVIGVGMGGPFAYAARLAQKALRITSYNVCYTKLLRAPPPSQFYWGAYFASAGTVRHSTCNHRITSYNVCYTKLLRYWKFIQTLRQIDCFIRYINPFQKILIWKFMIKMQSWFLRHLF